MNTFCQNFNFIAIRCLKMCISLIYYLWNMWQCALFVLVISYYTCFCILIHFVKVHRIIHI